jgi:long-chain acyl-CoA synthetase
MDRPWFRFYPTGVPPRLEYPQAPLYRLLQEAAARFPTRTALIDYDGEAGRELGAKDYRSLNDESDRFAAALVALGIGKGDRVAYFLQNSPALVVGFYGILKAGAVAVPCNPMYRERELAHQLRDCGAKAILCEHLLYPLVREVVGQTALRHVIVAGGAPDRGDHPTGPSQSQHTSDQPLVVSLSNHERLTEVVSARPSTGSGQTDNEKAGVYSMDALVESHRPLPKYPAIDPIQDLALLPYTGGTTGVPKGSMLSHFNLVANALQFKSWFQYREGEEVFIAALPLFHIGGIAGVMSVPLAAAATIVLFRRYHPRGVLQAIQKYQASRFLGVPTMYVAILNLEEARSFDLASLQPSRTSAAPLPRAVKEAFDRLVGREVLIEGYGLTEASPLTHANPTHRARAGSIGIPLPDTDARVVDPEEGTRVLPVGEVGELVVRGPQVMRGYWNQPGASAAALRDGWLYTGDLARMDGQGYFYVVDRKKDVINAAGFKVWPREVEEVLYQHPLIRAAAVIGVPDTYRGETVKAVVVLKGDHGFLSPDAAQEDIKAFCRLELAAYKVPRIVEFRDDLPISAAGKVLRRVLRDDGADEPG